MALRGVYGRTRSGNEAEEFLSGAGPIRASRNDFIIEGSERDALLEQVSKKNAALEDLETFMTGADDEARRLTQAKMEAGAWKDESQRKIPSMGNDQEVMDMEAATSVRVAAIERHLETRLDKVTASKERLGHQRDMILREIQGLEDALDIGAMGPGGETVVAATEFGPNSQWYSIRGVKGSLEEKVGVLILVVLGFASFWQGLC